MSEEFTQDQSSDASNVGGSASPESQSSPETQEAASSQEAGLSGGDSSKLPPFHEHPRFKELIEKNNSYKSELDTYKQSVQKMEAQLAEMQKANQAKQIEQQQQKKPSYETVLARLQNIDPEFGEFQKTIAQEMAAVPELKQQLQDFMQWKQGLERQNFQTQVKSKLSELYEKNKVPAEERPFYERQLKGLAADNPNAGLNELDAFFKQVHEENTKYFSDRDRKQKASYVESKKKDITPQSQSGGVPAGIPGKGNSQQDRIQAFASALRAAKQKV